MMELLMLLLISAPISGVLAAFVTASDRERAALVELVSWAAWRLLGSNGWSALGRVVLCGLGLILVLCGLSWATAAGLMIGGAGALAAWTRLGLMLRARVTRREPWRLIDWRKERVVTVTCSRREADRLAEEWDYPWG